MAKRGRPKGSGKENLREILDNAIIQLQGKKASEVTQEELIEMIQLLNKVIKPEKDPQEVLRLAVQALTLAVMKLILENAELRKQMERFMRPFLFGGLLSDKFE